MLNSRRSRRRRTNLSIRGTFSTRSRGGRISTSLSSRGRGGAASIRLSGSSYGRSRRSSRRASGNISLSRGSGRGRVGFGISFGF